MVLQDLYLEEEVGREIIFTVTSGEAEALGRSSSSYL